MNAYEITYIRTGRINETDKVWIYDGDVMNNGERVHNIIDTIKYFEELGEGWGTYENHNAIVSINIKKLGN